MSGGAYAVLGIDGTANREDLRRAYRDLVRRVHPDTGGSGDPAELATIQAAYRELSQVVPTAAPRPAHRRSRLVDVYA